jgi:pyruvate formate lyase activating enzyme
LDRAAEDILSICDAVNVDLKSFSGDSYKNILKGNLDTVLAFIKKAHALNVHLEISTLVVTGMNDNLDELERASLFIAELSEDIPWHLSAYHPEYRWEQPPTDTALLLEAARRAAEKLKFVYTGNIAGTAFSDTFCPFCKALLIRRRNYRVDCPGLSISGSDKKTALCSGCGKVIDSIRL